MSTKSAANKAFQLHWYRFGGQSTSTNPEPWHWPNQDCNANCRSPVVSGHGVLWAAKCWLARTMVTFGSDVRTQRASGVRNASSRNRAANVSCGSKHSTRLDPKNPWLSEPCGSASTSNTRWPA